MGDIPHRSLEQCKSLCDQNTMCESFAYASHDTYKGWCSLKDKVVKPNESQKVAPGYKTYYKDCTGKYD